MENNCARQFRAQLTQNEATQEVLLFGTKYSRMNQVKCFKRLLSQILLGRFLNILLHLRIVFQEKLISVA